MIGLIGGAMAHVLVGDPQDIATDIGPVIDREAFDKLVAHESYLKQIGVKLLARAPLDAAIANQGHYFAPAAYEIDTIKQLKAEVFGPVLHIIRYQESDLTRIIEDTNSSGYGLTFGLHTRIDSKIDQVQAAIHAGNIYINRTMIGAVVGVQPFGGQGLSGTGPKAGGPNYLTRFAHEKTITRNTAASGGNIKLVAGSD
jgi:RHH-type transcriptional regulator, proline utilization regulon repressor / proline dehydrogenase / delta 1-pyrroline-5-carboxylate dehydrogenase